MLLLLGPNFCHVVHFLFYFEGLSCISLVPAGPSPSQGPSKSLVHVSPSKRPRHNSPRLVAKPQPCWVHALFPSQTSSTPQASTTREHWRGSDPVPALHHSPRRTLDFLFHVTFSPHTLPPASVHCVVDVC